MGLSVKELFSAFFLHAPMLHQNCQQFDRKTTRLQGVIFSIAVWVGPNAKRSKRFSSANGAKTEQMVRGGFFLGTQNGRKHIWYSLLCTDCTNSRYLFGIKKLKRNKKIPVTKPR
jgi:hypothetical protein